MEIYTYIIVFVFKIDYTDLFQISRAPPAPGFICPWGRGHEIERKLRGTGTEQVGAQGARRRQGVPPERNFVLSTKISKNIEF